MPKSALPFPKTEPALSLADVEQYAEGWLLSCDIARHSPTTLTNRRLYLDKLLWFLKYKSLSLCGAHELRLFSPT